MTADEIKEMLLENIGVRYPEFVFEVNQEVLKDIMKVCYDIGWEHGVDDAIKSFKKSVDNPGNSIK